MGERPVWEIAERLAAGETIADFRDVRGTAYVLGQGAAGSTLEPSRYIATGNPCSAQLRAGRSRAKTAFSQCRERSNTRPTRATRDR